MRPVDVAGQTPVPLGDPGAAPMLQWVRIADLLIDDRYQREIKRDGRKAIRRIAGAFTWSKFSPVFCAPVAGGKFALIDGQHRAHAAALVGLEEVPAQIVQMPLAAQAGAFNAINAESIKITSFQIYRAELEAGEGWAVACRDTAEAAGCKLMASNKTAGDRKPGEIYILVRFRKMVEAGHGERMVIALRALLASESGADVEVWETAILRPWLNAVIGAPRLRDVGALAAFLDVFDFYAALDSFDKFMRERRRAGVQCAPKHELMAAEFATALDRHFAAAPLKAVRA